MYDEKSNLADNFNFLHWKDSLKEYFSEAIKESNQWMNQKLIQLYDTSDLIFQQKIFLIYISMLNTVYIITFLAVLWAAHIADKAVRKAVGIYTCIFVSPGVWNTVTKTDCLFIAFERYAFQSCLIFQNWSLII